MTKGVKVLLGALVTIFLGTIGSLVAAAIWDLRLPRWMLREPPTVLDESNLETNWLIVWLIVAALIIAAAMVLVVFQAQEPKRPRRPTEFDYKKDAFFNLVWRWRYGTGGAIQSIACFYRACDRQCQLQGVGTWEPEYAVMCNVHGEQHRFVGEGEQLLHDARIEIQRKLRNGEWKSVVESDRSTKSDGGVNS